MTAPRGCFGTRSPWLWQRHAMESHPQRRSTGPRLAMGSSLVPEAVPVTRRYRILHTITLFAQSSGAAENTKLTLNLLDRQRFEAFLATAPGQSMDGEVAADVIRVPLKFLRRPINPLTDLSALAELYRTIRRFRFDAVHTHGAKDGILGRWAARLA